MNIKFWGHRRCPVVVLLAWMAVIFIVTTYLITGGSHCDNYATELEVAKEQVRRLTEMNGRLHELVRQSRTIINRQKEQPKADPNQLSTLADIQNYHNKIGKNSPQTLKSVMPSYTKEKLRRRIANDAKEIWYYINSELNKIVTSNPLLKDRMSGILKYVINQTHAVQVMADQLGNIDGLKELRHQEMTKIRQSLIKRLEFLQHPLDCAKSRRLLCKLNKGCGYGCQIHHAVYCLIVAYATKRTLILDSYGWRYTTSGWNSYYKPISPTCKSELGSDGAAQWDHHNPSDLLVDLPISDSISHRPSYLPLAIPEDFSKTLLAFHGHPFVWFVGHMLRYLLRLQPGIKKYIEDKKNAMKFQQPIVGIQVRRTDKINSEAKFHSLEEYMVHVEEYYQKLERTTHVPVKRVFIASDDPSVFPEAQKKYKNYMFLSDSAASESAAVNSRYNDASLRGIILDVELLAQTDYLVCTFSSQVCRLAYELMQTYHDDASKYFHSLDDIYYFGGQNLHRHMAIYPHVANSGDEIDLDVGDIIAVAGNHWDGYSKGTLRKKQLVGLYPSYKTEDVPDISKFASYDDVV